MNASRLTLRAWHDRAYQPIFLAGADPRTLEAYSGTLGAWEKYTRDPPLKSITTLTLAEFRTALAASTSRVTKRLISPATVNKHLRHVGAMLSKAGPAGPRNRDALGVLDRVPWAKPMRLPRHRPRAVAQTTLARIYGACRIAVHPTISGLSAPTWWRALICTAYNAALRREALLALRRTDVDLTADVLHIAAVVDKRDTERVKPINAELRRHLVDLVSSSTSDTLFPWHGSWSLFYRQWHAIQDAAGLARADHHKLHDLKRACGTELGRTENAHTIAAMLDHTSIGMGAAYVDPTGPLRAAVERLPQPWRQAQRTLFD